MAPPGTVRPRRVTPRRRTAPQQGRDWWAEADVLLRRRSGGRCECCGGQLTNVERHHRVRRRDGGDRLSNLLYLSPAHHAWWTGHPEAARGRGIIVSALGELDPSTVPVFYQGRGWYLLDDLGGKASVSAGLT